MRTSHDGAVLLFVLPQGTGPRSEATISHCSMDTGKHMTPGLLHVRAERYQLVDLGRDESLSALWRKAVYFSRDCDLFLAC